MIQHFNRMKPGAVFINSGRGLQVVEDDLLNALAGPLRAAVLDVFRTEPLPAENPIWTHPAITVWPHVSAQTNAASAGDQIIAAIWRSAPAMTRKTVLMSAGATSPSPAPR